jgi:hypothetical protein
MPATRGSLHRLVSLSILMGIALASAAHAACSAGTYFVDLTTGQTLPATPPAGIVLQAVGPSPNPSCAGWKTALLRLDMTGCEEAEIAVEFEKPIAWTVHLADSPTSDGYGGDAGTTPHNAELWINQQTLWVSEASTPGGIDNPLAQENLNLNYGAMKFVVKNQHVSWGTPYNVVQTPSTKKLFSFPDPDVPAEGSYLYVGLNRVVAENTVRTGCGAQRAMITLE